MSFFDDLFDIAGAVTGVAGLFGGGGSADLEQAILRQQGLIKALLNPDSKKFQKIAGREEDAIRADLADALQQLQVADARAYGRTGFGLLNPERRDESIASAFIRGAEQAKAAARDRARQYLQAAINANASMFGPTLQAGQLQQAQLAGGIESAFDLGRGLFGTGGLFQTGGMLNGGQAPRNPTQPAATPGTPAVRPGITQY